jgi:3-oxoacyl-(acyl-carrier-protein) synthase
LGRILVTGIGIISAIGNNAGENRIALIEGKCGLTALGQFETRFSNLMPFGEIKTSNEFFAERSGVTQKGVTRPSFLALHAMNEALADAGWEQNLWSDSGTALVNASTVGGMCLTDELFDDANAVHGGSAYLASYDCASVSIFLQQYFGLEGNVSTINTACSSSANAIAYAARLIQSGFAKRAIAGGVDSLAKYTINGFNALHILSKEKCRPFDASRSGLNLGEAAAYLILEKEEDVIDKKIYAAVTGYCNANDAYHPSSLSETGEGPYLAMKGAIDLAGLNAGEIGFINAHGTGTENNDEVESVAMKRLFETPPPFISTKANTGHTLGAAGALEAAFSILNLYHQDIYPSIHFAEPIASTQLIPNTTYRTASIKHVMSNSFGFGGNCTSLIFSAP